METYTLEILGIEITFKTEINTHDLDKARKLLEARAEQLQSQGKFINKEKTLLFIALGLAHDWIQANKQLESIPSRIESIVSKCDKDSILL